jgi:hypothetical protein
MTLRYHCILWESSLKCVKLTSKLLKQMCQLRSCPRWELSMLHRPIFRSWGSAPGSADGTNGATPQIPLLTRQHFHSPGILIWTSINAKEGTQRRIDPSCAYPYVCILYWAQQLTTFQRMKSVKLSFDCDVWSRRPIYAKPSPYWYVNRKLSCFPL